MNNNAKIKLEVDIGDALRALEQVKAALRAQAKPSRPSPPSERCRCLGFRKRPDTPRCHEPSCPDRTEADCAWALAQWQDANHHKPRPVAADPLSAMPVSELKLRVKVCDSGAGSYDAAPQLAVPRDYTPPSRDGVGEVTVTVGGVKPACTCLPGAYGHTEGCPAAPKDLPTNDGPLPAGTKVPDRFVRVEPQSSAAPEPATAVATTPEPWRSLASMHGKAHRVLAEVERSLVELRDLEAQLDRAWRAAANVPPAAPEPAAAPPAGAGREVGR